MNPQPNPQTPPILYLLWRWAYRKAPVKDPAPARAIRARLDLVLFHHQGCVVSQKRRLGLIALAAWLSIIPAMRSFSQVPVPTTAEYARAIYTVIQGHWGPDSYNSELKPGSSCAARIVQMPGGGILSVDILPDCDFNEAGRAAVVAATRRSGPLPYYGYESVYQREVRFVFYAASISDRQALAADKAATEKVTKDVAENQRQWEATTGLSERQADYVERCRMHLFSALPTVELQHLTTVAVVVDRSGKVVDFADIKGPIDEPLAAALRATPPCERIPVDLFVGAGKIKIAPVGW